MSNNITNPMITAPAIVISNTDSKPMVTIHRTGKIEYGDDYTPDTAAKIFWDAMLSQNPMNSEPLVVELREQIKQLQFETKFHKAMRATCG